MERRGARARVSPYRPRYPSRRAGSRRTGRRTPRQASGAGRALAADLIARLGATSATDRGAAASSACAGGQGRCASNPAREAWYDALIATVAPDRKYAACTARTASGSSRSTRADQERARQVVPAGLQLGGQRRPSITRGPPASSSSNVVTRLPHHIRPRPHHPASGRDLGDRQRGVGGRSSAAAGRPRATSSAPSAATIAPLSVHSPGRGTRSRSPAARSAPGPARAAASSRRRRRPTTRWSTPCSGARAHAPCA